MGLGKKFTGKKPNYAKDNGEHVQFVHVSMSVSPWLSHPCSLVIVLLKNRESEQMTLFS